MDLLDSDEGHAAALLALRMSTAQDLVRRLNLVPAYLEQLTLASEPLHRTYQSLRLSVFLKVPGCWASGAFGAGKTVSMEYCAESLRAEFPNLPVFIVSEEVLPGNELKSFFVRALLESNHEKTSGSVTILRNRLARHWAELSRSSPLGCVVLFLDEGQDLRKADESSLKDLGNEIRRNGGSLLTIIFGESPKLDVLVSRRTADGTRDGATDRLFAGKKFEIHTYKDKEDWSSLLAEMDSPRFPGLNGLTIAEAFFGFMDMSRLRMENEGERLYRAIKATRKKYGNRVANLRRIFVGIRYALLSEALEAVESRRKAISEISEKRWYEAIEYGCQMGDEKNHVDD